MARELVVRIVGDSRDLERTYAKAAASSKRFNRNIESAGRGAIVASLGFRGLGRSVAFASGAFLGGAGLASAAKTGFDEMLRGQAVAADTAAALKSTGSVAGVTAKQIEALGTSLQQLSGYDDEAIRGAENLILTFTNVRNVAGQGNDIFTQATKSTLDLSRRFDQDLTTSAVQLGKALADPVKGVLALRRAGITFSGEQQRMINRLVSTGRLLEAQKVILREVRRETEGAAAAYGKTLGGQLEILKGNLENLAGTLAELVAPAVQDATEQLNKWLANPDNKKAAQEKVAKGFDLVGAAARVAGHSIEGYALAWEAASRRVGRARKAFLGFAGAAPPTDFPDLAGPSGTPTKTGRPAGPRGPLRGAADPGAAAALKAKQEAEAKMIRDAKARAARLTVLRNQWFDQTIGRELVDAQDVSTLKGQIARLRQISGEVSARLAVTKDITRKLTLEDQIKSIARESRGLQDQLAAEAGVAREAAQEERMGWLDFAVERAEATKPLKDDIRAQEAVVKFLEQRIRHEGRKLELVSELWRRRQKIADLNKGKSDVDPLAGLMQLSSKRLASMLAAGTGLSGAGRARLGQNIGRAAIQPVYVENHVHLDGREVATSTNQHNARGAHRTGKQTSGRRG